MAILYVSNFASNGYAVGNDTGATRASIQSKSTPALTVTKAVSLAVTGDEVRVNAASAASPLIYNEASSININSGSAYSLTINPEIDYGAVIRSASGTTRIIYCGPNVTLTLGKIVLDANNTQIQCIDTGTSNGLLIINGTHLQGATTYGISLNLPSMIMMNDWVVTQTTGSQGLRLNPYNNGNIILSSGTINISGPGSGGNLYAINGAPVGGITGITIKNVKMDISSTNPNVMEYAANLSGFASYDIHDNNVRFTSMQSMTGGNQGFYIPNSATSSSKVWIYDNDIRGYDIGVPVYTYSVYNNGHGILVGDDYTGAQQSTAFSHNGIWIHGNTLKNFNHALLVGWVKYPVVHSNYIEMTFLGIIGKGTKNALVSGNILKCIGTGGALRLKGSDSDLFINNTVIMTNSLNLPVLLSDNGGVAINNATIANNLFYFDGVTTDKVVMADSTVAHSVAYKANNYYSTAGLTTTNFFTDGVTTYASFADWKAAKEPSALNVNPGFRSYPADLRIPATSPLYHAGAYVHPWATDFKGRPFYVRPTIGAYEVGSGDPAAIRAARR